MEEKMIQVSQVKSNRSDNMVWQVGVSGETAAQFCTSPLKALRFAFMLKKQTGCNITMDSVATLQEEIRRLKEAGGNPHEEDRIETDTLSASVRQYKDLKAKHPDALFLFREDDFYTAYSEDAECISDILGIVVTKKGRRNAASFPSSALDTYLPRLVRAGKRIAICDPLSEAAA